MTHDWIDQAMKLVKVGQKMAAEIDEIIGVPEQRESPWTGAQAYDGEPIKTDLTEGEQAELLAALDEAGVSPDESGDGSVPMVIPVDRDWVSRVMWNIRRQERQLAEQRLRARLGNMFTPGYVEELAKAVNPPEE